MGHHKVGVAPGSPEDDEQCQRELRGTQSPLGFILLHSQGS